MSGRLDKTKINSLMAEGRIFRMVLPTPIPYKDPKRSGHITEMFGDGIAFVVLTDTGEEVYIDGNEEVELR